MTSLPEDPIVGRTAQKRQAILAAATAAFLRSGFQGTSMDEIAAQAGVSKQTVYKQFTDKARLFREIVDGVASRSDQTVAALVEAFGHPPASNAEELEARLRRVSLAYLERVLQPQVLALRRLVIAETERFPDLASRYYKQAPSRGIDVIAKELRPYLESGLLVADDLRLAAAHFAYLTLALPQDRALFIPTESPSRSEQERFAAAAARAFLAAYGRGR